MNDYNVFVIDLGASVEQCIAALIAVVITGQVVSSISSV
jgi:uncharacterized ubiquitin-like protein YukD